MFEYWSRKDRTCFAIVMVVIVFIYMGFNDYKSEVFECDMIENTCQMTLTNWYGMKKIIEMPEPAAYTEFSTSKARRHRRHHTDVVYYLDYTTIQGYRTKLFQNPYSDEYRATSAAAEIQHLLKTSKNGFTYSRY